MIKVTKEINLGQLDREYNGEGLIATLNDNGAITEIGLADNNSGNETQLQEIIKNHIAIDEQAIKAAEKAAVLTKLGLTAEEMAALLS